ncbi:DinB family protein [Saccharopolyspora indica]|uniref:DinB family protein n=1 Tax=Saccharopolyspora indica TaxID=1229659 RepID=UPI0022EA5F0E|nr:DinB family protein [Saccharopolyspora indica]MDA3644718.1 DinB family protein [Saccharopolyspora indica]
MTDDAPRGDLGPPNSNTDERTTLLTFLDYLREAVIAKTAGLSDQQARTPGVASGTSVLGLIKHLTAVEANWFEWSYDGADVPVQDDEAPLAADETADQLISAYRRAIRRSNEVVLACDDLGTPGARSVREATPPSMRWILVHMIEETARHAGHADILREHIDGSVGR